MSQIGAGESTIAIEEEQPQVPQIEGVPTTTVLALGVALRGPVGKATPIDSYEDFLRIFGGDTGNGFLSHAVRGFYAEGGQSSRMYVSRVVHHSNVEDPDTKTSAAGTVDIDTDDVLPSAATVVGLNVGPFDLEPGDTLLLAVDGNSALTATFNATAASRNSGGAGPFALSNGQTLTLKVDGGSLQTITFSTSEFANIGAATRAEVVAVLNAQLRYARASDITTNVKIASDVRGTSSSLEIVGGTANSALSFALGTATGTGNVADIDEVTVAEVKTIVEAAVATCTVSNAGGAARFTSNTTGGSSSIQVTAASTADDELGVDNAVHTGSTGAAQPTLTIDAKYDGAYSDKVSVKVLAATNGVAEAFDFQVINDGVVTAYPNLTMDPDADRFALTVLNDATTGSPLVELVDLGLVGTALQRRPANGTYGPLEGGDDGLASLGDNDFVGTEVGQTGLYSFDGITEGAILICPDRATPVVHNSMITYCEVHREGSIFAILDPPASLSATQMVEYVKSTALLLQSSEFAAIYWPRVLVQNPNTAIYGNAATITVPPSGIIAGVYARNDSKAGGVYTQPAGVNEGRMLTVQGFETEEQQNPKRRALVFPNRINPLTADNGIAPYVDGARTLKSNGNWASVGQRRGVIFIEQSIKGRNGGGLQFARHKNNTVSLRRQCQRATERFLEEQIPLGAFKSTNPAQAFFVDFGEALNPPNLVSKGRMRARIGLATNAPAEFISLLFSEDTRSEAQTQ